ncbi:hypothetical protein DRN74_06270 [Candidatus Micrarchaeota archaeon]|nr:MAG: hypothetical protein DRN74_06270 [Candidatus Micrarchaeota archaeon]
MVFSIIKNWFRHPEPPQGIIEDPRKEEEKELDYQDEEILEVAPIAWPRWEAIKTKIEKDLSHYKVFNQDGSSSCLAQATALALGIDNYLEEGKFIAFSPADIYCRRANKPRKGMYFQDALHLAYKRGATLYDWLPTDGLNEEEINKLLDKYLPSYGEVAKVFKAGNYFWIKDGHKDIERVAYWLNVERRPVILGVAFGNKEWPRTEPKILTKYAIYRHGICAVPEGAFLKNGKAYILIQDSWGVNSGWNGRRFVSEDWWKQGRILGALTFKKLKNTWRSEEDRPKPKYKFERDLVFGMKNEDVRMLQECLKYEELFPINVPSTGWYGNITAKAVYKFQVKYEVAPMAELDALKGRRVRPKTRAKLNELFGK